MADFCKKYIVPTVILIVFGVLFLTWYLYSQNFICETAMIFYQQYVSFNEIHSLSEIVKTLFTSIQTDTRNYLPALYLKPFYLIGKEAYKSYILGIFFLCYLPAFAFILAYINKNTEKTTPYITLFLLMSTPVFWYTTALGYPDILSVGLFAAGLLITCKNKLSQNISPKILLAIALIFYLAFVFRRWLIFVVISYLISVVIYEFANVAADKTNLSIEQKKSTMLNTLKNTAVIGGIFFALIAICQHNVFLNFFDENYRKIFDGYKVPLKQNLDYLISYLSLPIVALMFWAAHFASRNPQKSQFMIFSLINMLTFVFVFNATNVICVDHALVFAFWLTCFIIAAIQNLLSTIEDNKLKKRAIIAIVLIFGFNFLYTFNDKPTLSKMLVSNCFFKPYEPQNEDILKEIESDLRSKLEENPKFQYSIWAFENKSFNPHLLFQNGEEHKYFLAGIFPPLIDTEAIVTGKWGFIEIVNADEIYTTEPLQSYGRAEDNKILFKIHEMLANKEGFGQNFSREETPYELDNEEIVVKYTRNKKVTKEQFEDLKQKITEIYPWAKDYYPEYMDDLCK